MSDALGIQHYIIRQKSCVKNHLFFIYLSTDIKNKVLIILLLHLIVHVIELTCFVCWDKWPLAARPRTTKQKRKSKTEVIFQCITLCNLISFVPYCEQICLHRMFQLGAGQQYEKLTVKWHFSHLRPKRVLGVNCSPQHSHK